MNEWISVKERMPDKEAKYLVTHKDGAVDVEWFVKAYNDWNYSDDIVAWCPIPRKFKADKEM